MFCIFCYTHPFKIKGYRMSENDDQTPKTAKLAKAAPPCRPINRERREREYLSEKEIDQVYQVAKRLGRHGHRDAMLILLMFRHGLRVGEAAALRWSQVDCDSGLLHVTRLKNGIASTHPLHGLSIRGLRRLQKDYPTTPYVFVSERGAPLTVRTIRHIVARAGEEAGLPFSIHPHMLRHSTGFYLANKGIDTRSIQVYLGHANIKNTVIYTQLSSARFQGFWLD